MNRGGSFEASKQPTTPPATAAIRSIHPGEGGRGAANGERQQGIGLVVVLVYVGDTVPLDYYYYYYYDYLFLPVTCVRGRRHLINYVASQCMCTTCPFQGVSPEKGLKPKTKIQLKPWCDVSRALP